MPGALDQLKVRFADINALTSALAVLEWDQQCYMPRGGGEARAAHIGCLSRMAHEAFVADEFRALLDHAAGEVDPETEEGALVRVVKRDVDLQTKLPSSLVEEKARLAGEGHEVWVAARSNNDFKSFAPLLDKMFDLVRQEAECLGYTDHIYDALLDQYEEGSTAQDVRSMFESLKGPNVKLVQDIAESGNQVDDSKLFGQWDIERQKAFTEMLVKTIGYDMGRGRQDQAPHPFCTTFSVGDVRLTTRFKPYIASAIFGSLHEAGHGMYEQGSPMEWDRTPLAGGVSLGIHESQSRTWENIVGRSKAFWTRFLPDLQQQFPAFADTSVNEWYRMINKVEPSLIRVEADEVTYNLHVLIRFEIECDMLTGSLKINDLPQAWNAKYKQYLGIEPPSDADGCLQDVHWAGGSIGYFPTYSMGNLLSYQIWNRLRRDLGDADALIEAGKFEPILAWLKENLYRHGKRYAPKDLVMRVTGKPMGAEDYVTAIDAKYRALYAI